jgi:AcrR family transcriptional regulator
VAPGLRERKKRATVNAIERAGVRLALEKGFEKVSVMEICDEADISRSTFFNYMPTREAAIFGRPLRMVPLDQALAILDEQAGKSLLAGIFHVSLVSIGGAEINPEVAAGRNRLGVEQPHCMHLMLAPMTTLTLELIGLVAIWLEADHGRRRLPEVSVVREASHVVTVAGGALTALMAEMKGGADDSMLSIETLEELVREIEVTAAKVTEPSA